jgi:hypothetical protein
MMKDWKKYASLVLDTLSDIYQLVILTVLPTPASSTNGVDRMRALHLSALIAITVLAIWMMKATETPGGADFNPLFFIILTILYFTLVSWAVFGALRATKLYEPKGETISDALTLVIGFGLIGTFVAAVIAEADVLMHLRLGGEQLHALIVWGALSIAVIFGCVRIWIKLPKRTASRLGKAGLIVALLCLATWIFIEKILLQA